MELLHGGLKLGRPVALATVRHWLQDRIGLSPAVQMHLLVTIIVIAGLWIIERVVLAIVYRRVTDPWSRYRWRLLAQEMTREEPDSRAKPLPAMPPPRKVNPSALPANATNRKTLIRGD